MPSLWLPHEWLAVCLVLAIVGGLTLFSWNQYSDSLPISIDQAWLQEEKQEEKLKVEIQGAVRQPGVYLLPQGARLKVLLEQAQPLPEADLRSIRQNQKLRSGQCICILERPWITIYISGAVERAGAYRVREGTPLSELPDVCPLHPQADCKGLRSKRRLVDEEHIHVPFL